MNPRPSDIISIATELAAALRARGYVTDEPHISYVSPEFFGCGDRWAIAFLHPELRVFSPSLEDATLKMTRKILALPRAKTGEAA